MAAYPDQYFDRVIRPVLYYFFCGSISQSIGGSTDRGYRYFAGRRVVDGREEKGSLSSKKQTKKVALSRLFLLPEYVMPVLVGIGPKR
jgi:hypothetical protein